MNVINWALNLIENLNLRLESVFSQHSAMESEFNQLYKNANSIVVLTGAGISADSGIPTFRGEGAYWRGYAIEQIAKMSKFKEDPSLVWELYHYRREVVLPKAPNKAHLTLTTVQKRLESEGKTMNIITQNIDELHTKAGSKNVIELHGTLFKTRCLECGDVKENYESPICPSLFGRGGKDDKAADIDKELLPRCKDCGGLVRPHIVWFDEDPSEQHMQLTYDRLDACDLLLIIGTSAIVDPADGFGPYVAGRGVPVVEFNLEHTPVTKYAKFHFGGPCAETLDILL